MGNESVKAVLANDSLPYFGERRPHPVSRRRNRDRRVGLAPDYVPFEV